MGSDLLWGTTGRGMTGSDLLGSSVGGSAGGQTRSNYCKLSFFLKISHPVMLWLLQKLKKRPAPKAPAAYLYYKSKPPPPLGAVGGTWSLLTSFLEIGADQGLKPW